MRYFIYTTKRGMTYNGNTKRPPHIALLQGFADARFGGDHIDRKSTKYTTGIVITYNNYPISSDSKNKTLMFISTAEWEYIELDSATQNLQALKRLLIESHITANGPKI